MAGVVAKAELLLGGGFEPQTVLAKLELVLSRNNNSTEGLSRSSLYMRTGKVSKQARKKPSVSRSEEEKRKGQEFIDVQRTPAIEGVSRRVGQERNHLGLKCGYRSVQALLLF